MALVKSRIGLEQYVTAPLVEHAIGPVCMTCGRIVDSEALVEGYPGESTWCKVLVKHHGAEELRTFDMGSSNWDERDLKSMMTRTNWFDPGAHEGLGLGQKVSPDLEADHGPEPKPLIVVPR